MNRNEIPLSLQVNIEVPAYATNLEGALAIMNGLANLPYGAVSPLIEAYKKAVQTAVANYQANLDKPEAVVADVTVKAPAPSPMKVVKKAGRPKKNG